VNGVVEAAVTDDELAGRQLDRVPRVDDVVSERDRAHRVTAGRELFDGADVVAGDEHVVGGRRRYRHTARTVTDRPLRHRSSVHLDQSFIDQSLTLPV